MCAGRIRGVRALELQALVAWWGVERTMMMTLTVRHGLGDDLRAVRAGVGRAGRWMQSSGPWKLFREAVGLADYVKALEVTHGWRNGWHPHLHVLLLVTDPAVLREKLSWLRERWAEAVRREVGVTHVPSERRGVVLTSASDGAYLSKMGASALEMTDAAQAKVGKNGNRGPWEIAAGALAEIEAGRRGRDCALWQAYCSGMRGARALTWSRGLKARAGIKETLDAEAARRDGEGDGAVQMAAVPLERWWLVPVADDGEIRLIHAALDGWWAGLAEDGVSTWGWSPRAEASAQARVNALLDRLEAELHRGVDPPPPRPVEWLG